MRQGLLIRTGVSLLACLLMTTTSRAQHTKDTLETVKKKVVDKEAILVDVREEEEWQEGHLKDARFLPLSKLSDKNATTEVEKVLTKDKVIYLHCASGRRCVKAAQTLQKLGYDVRPLKAGYEDLLKAGFSKAEEKK